MSEIDLNNFQKQSEKLSESAGYFQNFLLQTLQSGSLPRHIAFIMDGNRRFAQKKSIPVSKGHEEGAQVLVKAVYTCYRLGITEVTAYALSIENFNRSPKEIDNLYAVLRTYLEKFSNDLDSKGYQTRVRIVGNKALIVEDVKKGLENIEKQTDKPGCKFTLNICFAYTSRDEITRSMCLTATQRQQGSVSKNQINEEMVSGNMDVSSSCAPDILIRTSGHTRLSDFLMWQCNTHCKIVYLSTLWPDFGFMQLYFTILVWACEQQLASFRYSFLRARREKSTGLHRLPHSPPFASVSKDTD